MRLSVIDCGTNTFNLLVVELAKGQSPVKVYNTRIPVKLGEGAINEGYISPAALQRAENAISSFNKDIQHYKVEKTIAFATSAIRDARNGADLVSVIRKKFGISIQVIDGEREAQLIYLGVREAVRLSENCSLIMDIGGGSTEFILANKTTLFWKHSFNLGAARILERFKPSDPITQQETKAINDHLRTELSLLFDTVKQLPPSELVGSSGAFDSIVEMIHTDMDGEPLLPEKTSYEIDLQKYFRLSETVIASTLSQRRQMKGLVPMRQDMIVISCLMMDFILRELNLGSMRVSTYSLKEGALVDFIERELNK